MTVSTNDVPLTDAQLRVRNPVTWVMIGFVRLWRLAISPLYGDVCKFYPTCSAYGLQALRRHGAVRGVWLTVRRIARCHPWSLGGFDPVPGSDLERVGQTHDHAANSTAERSRGARTEAMTLPGTAALPQGIPQC